MDTIIGTIGNYDIMSELARTAFSTVYLGRHTLLKRAAAIKLMHIAYLQSKAERERFLEEAQFLEKLRSHPHILSILDAGIHNSLPYIVTEYAANGTLAQRITNLSPHPLPIDEALSILFQIGQALEDAHQLKITHRDIKPENVFFNDKGSVLLGDFGIAIVLEAAKTKKMVDVIGSPPYMAPEQFNGEVSMRSDQYALGCIAYEMMTGRKLFTASTSVAYGIKHQTETPIPPRSLNGLITPSIEKVILRALEKDRELRYPTITTFLAALNKGQPQRENIDRWLSEGEKHLNAQRYSEALAAYEQAIAHDPQHISALYNYGITLYSLKDYENALIVFERALWQDHYFTNGYIAKGLTLQKLQFYTKALDAFEKALQLDHRNAITFYNKGFVLARLKRYEEAIDAYDQALQILPGYALAYNNKSLALYFLDRNEEALANCEKAIQHALQFADAYNSRGLIFEKLERKEEALASYDAAIYHGYGRAYINRGNVLYALKRYAEALLAFERAIQFAPGDADAYNNRGRVLCEFQRYEEALSAYEQAIIARPDEAIFYRNKGDVLQHLGRLQEAQQAYEDSKLI